MRIRYGIFAKQHRRDQAKVWYFRHRSQKELSPVELRKWEKWFADTRNSAAYDEIEQLYARLRALPRPQLPDGPLAITVTNRLPRTPPWSLVSIAAFLALGMLLLFVVPSHPTRTDLPGAMQSYATGIGEQKRVMLPDGSSTVLSGATTVNTRITAEQRTAYLERGAALFQVKSDRKHPFIVHAGTGTITAVGTEFDVHRYSERVEITVTEGSVRVSPRSNNLDDISVVEGEELTYDLNGRANPPRKAHRRIGWPEGELAYEDTPLREVIEDARRHVTMDIDIDKESGDLTYSGDIDPSGVEDWLRNLPATYARVAVDEPTAGHLTIRYRSSKGATTP